jgi:hypothetical protein
MQAQKADCRERNARFRAYRRQTGYWPATEPETLCGPGRHSGRIRAQTMRWFSIENRLQHARARMCARRVLLHIRLCPLP